MAWKVVLKESVIADLRWFGRKDGRLILKEADKLLAADPLLETRNVKRLRPNPVAHGELRVFGRYRVLFNIDETRKEVTIVLVGEKRGSSLLVQGKEYTEHHESDPSQ
jgi:mRNA-degrading endonuclease RelE of RelBE toxin-antitoxin system